MKRHVIITPDWGESWYWLRPGTDLDITDRDTLIACAGHRSPARYDLLWAPDLNLTLEYRDDLAQTCRWAREWMEYVFRVEPLTPDDKDPLMPGFSPVKELLVQYRPSIYEPEVCRARLGVYRRPNLPPVVILARRFLPGTYPPEDRPDPEFAHAIRVSTLYGLDILATIVSHYAEYLDLGVDKTLVTWIVRYGVSPARRQGFDHPFIAWHLMPCKWHCPGGQWWVADYDLKDICAEDVRRILQGKVAYSEDLYR